MFYYISFLRPPPLQSLPSTPITITPQIANDLRTEPFEGSQDIYFAWSPITNNPDSPGFATTKPTKLTTWRQSNAYKEITVPSPPNVREGQSWRLVLCSEPQRISVAFQPGSELGTAPFPVVSMPIVFTRNASKGREKQERIERIYRFSVRNQEGEPAQVAMRVTEQTSFDLDKKIWDSGIGLSSWLVDLVGLEDEKVEMHCVKTLKNALFSSDPRTIVELGAGTGIVSLTLGALRSGIESSEVEETGCIITTDLPSAMPLLEYNISNNSHLCVRSATVRPRAEVLDWDEDLPAFTQTLEGRLDAIIMADVTYNTASFPSLIRTIEGLMRLGPSDNPPVLLLGYKERDSAERSLWDMAAGIGIQFEKVGKKTGAGGAAVEVWIGQLRKP